MLDELPECHTGQKAARCLHELRELNVQIASIAATNACGDEAYQGQHKIRKLNVQLAWTPATNACDRKHEPTKTCNRIKEN